MSGHRRHRAAGRNRPQCSTSGVPLWPCSAFGFSVLALSLSTRADQHRRQAYSSRCAFGRSARSGCSSRALGVPHGNLFGATFGVGYACFLFTTPMILRWFAPEIALPTYARCASSATRSRLLVDVGSLHGVLTYGAYS